MVSFLFFLFLSFFKSPNTHPQALLFLSFFLFLFFCFSSPGDFEQLYKNIPRVSIDHPKGDNQVDAYILREDLPLLSHFNYEFALPLFPSLSFSPPYPFLFLPITLPGMKLLRKIEKSISVLLSIKSSVKFVNFSPLSPLFFLSISNFNLFRPPKQPKIGHLTIIMLI